MRTTYRKNDNSKFLPYGKPIVYIYLIMRKIFTKFLRAQSEQMQNDCDKDALNFYQKRVIRSICSEYNHGPFHREGRLIPRAKSGLDATWMDSVQASHLKFARRSLPKENPTYF